MVRAAVPVHLVRVWPAWHAEAGANPTSSASATSAFGEVRDHWSATARTSRVKPLAALARRLWRRWRLVRKPDDPATYARKVLVNRYRSLLRHAVVEARYRYRARPADGYSDEHREDAIVLWAATRRLPPRQRAVLVLRYYEDLSEAEIARVLGIPVGTVKSLARRGLARLRRSLDAPSQGDTVGSKERA
jgi:RNA polymerase sigma factor (sigma-70 family)